MPTILAIDTSATPVSCAIVRDARILASFFSHSGLTHSQTLMPMVKSAMSIAGIDANALDAIAVSVGPGSFTGVRIGVSAVKGLAFANNIPCVAVSTLESMADGLRGIPFEGVVCCVMDARCHQVYTARFAQHANGTQQRLSPDEAISIDTLKQELKHLNKSVIFVGDGSEMCYNLLKDAIPDLHLAPLSVRYQSATGVALVAEAMYRRGETVPSDKLLPSYLRLPQAERELKERQLNQK